MENIFPGIENGPMQKPDYEIKRDADKQKLKSQIAKKCLLGTQDLTFIRKIFIDHLGMKMLLFPFSLKFQLLLVSMVTNI